MIARNLISESVLPAKSSDTAGQVLDLLEVFRLSELPVLNSEGDIIGVVTETLASDLNEEAIIGDHIHHGLVDHVAPIDHIFDIIKILGEKSWTMIPVLNKEGKYRGIITQEEIFRAFATSFSVREQGAIIVVEIKRSAYAMSEVSQIVESENAAIISCFLADGKDLDHLRVTVKVNKMDIQFILAAFERYGYDVIASFTGHDFVDTLKDRYDHLMAYLNV